MVLALDEGRAAADEREDLITDGKSSHPGAFLHDIRAERLPTAARWRESGALSDDPSEARDRVFPLWVLPTSTTS